MAVVLGVLVFTIVVIGLVCLIIGAKSYLVPAGNVKILVNEQKEISVPQGGKLMGALAEGGRVGTCRHLCLRRQRRHRALAARRHAGFRGALDGLPLGRGVPVDPQHVRQDARHIRQ